MNRCTHVFLLGLLAIGPFSHAEAPEMTPFLSAQILKEDLNSKDAAKLNSAVSYVGGIADYLLNEKKICPPPGADRSNRRNDCQSRSASGLQRISSFTAATPVTFALRMGWSCKS